MEAYIKVFITKKGKFRARVISKTDASFYEVTIGGKPWNDGKGQEHKEEIRKKCAQALTYLNDQMKAFGIRRTIRECIEETNERIQLSIEEKENIISGYSFYAMPSSIRDHREKNELLLPYALEFFKKNMPLADQYEAYEEITEEPECGVCGGDATICDGC